MRNDLAALADILRRAFARVLAESSSAVVIGGSVLRAADDYAQLVTRVARSLGVPVYPLDTEGEGRALAAAHALGDEELLIDVGGGSVQAIAVQGGGDYKVLSWPLGTYEIERRYDLKQGRSSLDAYLAVAEKLSDEISLAGRWPTLVVGSSVVATFLETLGRYIGLSPFHEWSIESLEEALKVCVQLPSSEFSKVMPDNPGFMFGAEKLILIALVVAKKIEARVVRGTNASISEGVARLACSDGEGLPIDTPTIA